MNRGMRAVLIILGFGALAFVVLGLTGWWWWSQHGAEFQANTMKGIDQGIAFGKLTDQDGCLKEGFDRNHKNPDAVAAQFNLMFLSGCLSTAKPSPEFCQDVPSQWNTFAASRWTTQRCVAEGLNESTCPGMLNALIGHCQNGVFGPAFGQEREWPKLGKLYAHSADPHHAMIRVGPTCRRTLVRLWWVRLIVGRWSHPPATRLSSPPQKFFASLAGVPRGGIGCACGLMIGSALSLRSR